MSMNADLPSAEKFGADDPEGYTPLAWLSRDLISKLALLITH